MAQENLQYVFDILKGKNTLGPEFKKIQDQADGIQDTLKGITKAAGVAFAGFSASILGTVKVASNFQKIATSFDVLTGSVEKTTEVMSILKKTAATDAFSFEEVSNAAKRFLTFGFSIKELDTLLTQVGDVAAISGASIEDLARIFGKISTEGKVTSRELNQLQLNAIPIGPALAKTMGIGEESVKRLAEQGRINFDQFKQAFSSLSKEGGFAFGGLSSLSETLSGRLNNMGDEVEFLSADIGKFFIPAFSGAIKYVTEFLKSLRENEALTEFISKFLAVGAAVTGIVAAIASVASALIGLSLAFKAVTIAAQLAGVTLKTALISSGIGAAVIGLSIAVTDLAINWEIRSKQIAIIWNELGRSASAITDNIKTFFFVMLELIKARFTLTFDILKTILEGFANTALANLTKAGDAINKAIKFDFKGAGKELGEFGKVTSESLGKTGEALTKVSDDYDKFKESLKDKEKYVPVNFNPDLSSVKKASEEIKRPVIREVIFKSSDVSQFERSIASIADAFKKNGVVAGIKQFGKESVKIANNITTSVQNAWKNADFSKLKESLVPAFANALKSGEQGAKQFLSGAASAVAVSMFGPIGQAVGPIADLLMMSSDELSRTLDSFFQAIPRIVEQIINNIPVIILAIIRNLPMLLEAFTAIAIKYGTDPIFWNKIMLAVATAFIASVPLMVEGFVRGLKNGLVEGIVSSITEAFEKLGGFWKNIFKFDGGGKGVVENFLGFDFPFIKFAKGGRVKGTARTSGDSTLNDTVPALLSPGEIVIPRSAALGGSSSIMNFLGSMNAVNSDGSPVRMGFGGFVGSVISSVGSAIGSAVNQATSIVDSVGNILGGTFSTDFIENKLLDAAFTVDKMTGENLSGFLSKLGLSRIGDFLEIIRSLLRLGLNPDVESLISDPFNYVPNLIKNNVGIFQKQFRSLLRPLPLAMGGMPLGAGFSDSIPAMLTPNELVVDRTTTRQLQNFLNGQGGSNILSEILATVQQPLVVKTTANVNGQAFADIILELNRKNARLS